MARHGGVYRNVDIFVKCGYFYAVLISSTVFQYGIQAAISGFGLVSILFSNLANPNILYSINCDSQNCSKLSRDLTVRKALKNIQ